jgi:hypothetical protein
LAPNSNGLLAHREAIAVEGGGMHVGRRLADCKNTKPQPDAPGGSHEVVLITLCWAEKSIVYI